MGNENQRSGVVTCLLAMLYIALATGEAQCASIPAKAEQRTPFWHIVFNEDYPGFSEISLDSFGRGVFENNELSRNEHTQQKYVHRKRNGWTEYALASSPRLTGWRIHCQGNTLLLRHRFVEGGSTEPLVLRFNPDRTHAALLGHTDVKGNVKLPALLHLPGMGSARIYAKGMANMTLGFDARRSGQPFVQISFPAATRAGDSVEYSLQAVNIYPDVPGVRLEDRVYDGFKRDFLNIFQLQAQLHVLANNASSDPCPFTLYFAADLARYTPQLVEGLSALDLVRESLDLYLAGFKGYGMPGFHMFDGPDDSVQPHVFLDVYPSLLISTFDYVDATGDSRWLAHNYVNLRKWADAMIAPNADGSPLLEYPESGNSGSWQIRANIRPSNWWDTVGFGHQDAYANALAFRALRCMAKLADRAGQAADAARYTKRADAIRSAYLKAFLDSSTGVLAGWKSADGTLHDYYFLFVNGIAVRYGLVGSQSQEVMTRIWLKMKDVGYSRFEFGLPGNLVPIHRSDYVDLNPRYGGPAREDGRDGFQVYENGGATACFSYFTVAALYKVGRTDEADSILMPMLQSFSTRGFSGRAANGMTNDWKDWDGHAHGYEGFLTDSYYLFLAVLDHSKTISMIPGEDL